MKKNRRHIGLWCTLLCYFLNTVLTFAAESTPTRSSQAIPSRSEPVQLNTTRTDSKLEIRAGSSGGPPATGTVSSTEASNQSGRVDVAAKIASSTSEIKDAIRASHATVWDKVVPALLGLLGVTAGAAVSTIHQKRQLEFSLKLQKQKLDHDMAAADIQHKANNALAKKRAGYESLSKRIDYKSRQLDEFYYPIQLMLLRSARVRKQLCDQLVKLNPEIFQYGEIEGDGRSHLYVVEENKDRARLRLVEHMLVITKHYKQVIPLINEIVAIGGAISKLIYAKGGLLLVSSASGSNDMPTPLTELLGHYLAHFSILGDVLRKAIDNPSQLECLHYNVTYPIALDRALRDDIDELSNEVQAWRDQAEALWST